VRVTLRTSESSDSRITSQIPLLNTPELLADFWKFDFDQDPTQADLNYDARPDWEETSGSSPFDVARLSGGAWQARASDGVALRTAPDRDFTNVTTIDLRCRNTTYSASGHGARCWMNLDRQGNTHGALFTSVRREADGTQTARVYAMTGPSTDKILAEAKGLSAGLVDFRLVVDPSADVVSGSTGSFRSRSTTPASR
jgi:hypothetical protein